MTGKPRPSRLPSHRRNIHRPNTGVVSRILGQSHHSGSKLLPALLLLTFLFTSTPSSGQDEVFLPVGFKGEFETDPDGGDLQLSLNLVEADGSCIGPACDIQPSPTSYERVWVKPAKPYVFLASGTGIIEYLVNLVPPNGYKVIFDGIERRIAGPYSGAGFPSTHSFVILCESCSEFAAPAGEDSDLLVGDVIWRVSMGLLSNGDSAGYIELREEELEEAIFDPSALFYTSNSNEVTVDFTGTAGQTLDRIETASHLADIEPIFGGYEIQFFAKSHLATPFVVYQIEKSGDPVPESKLKLSKTVYENEQPVTLAVVEAERTGSGSSGSWDLVEPDNIATEVIDVSSGNGASKIETSAKSDNTGGQAIVVARHFKNFGGKERLWKVVEDPGGDDLITVYDYYDESAGEGQAHQLKSIVYPDGNWVKYEYYNDDETKGEIAKEFRPFRDGPANPLDADDTNSRVITREYIADWTSQKTLPFSVTEKILGTQVRERSYVHAFSALHQSQKSIVTTREDYSASGESQITVTARFRKDAEVAYAERLIFIKRSDGSMGYTAYERGRVTDSGGSWEFDPGAPDPDGWRETTWYGSASGEGGAVPHPDSPILGHAFYLLPSQSHRTVELLDNRGLTVRTETQFLGNDLPFDETDTVWSEFRYDHESRLISRTSSIGTSWSANWVVWQEGSPVVTKGWRRTVTDEEGTVTISFFDKLDRLVEQTRPAATVEGILVPELNITFSYNSEDSLRFQHINPDSTNTIKTERQYHPTGRLKTISTPGPSETDYDTNYSYTNGGSTTTVTYPDGGVETISLWRDGSIKSVTGSAVVDLLIDYGIDPSNGNSWTKTYVGTWTGGPSGPFSADRWARSTSNWRGQVIKEETPAFEGNGSVVQRYIYDPVTGLLERAVTEDDQGDQLVADTLFEYDTRGQLLREGLDIVAGGLELNSEDSLREYDSRFVKEGGRRSRSRSEALPPMGRPRTFSKRWRG